MSDTSTDTGTGGAQDDWRASLPEDLRDSPALKDYKDVGGLAKSHVELQRKLGERPGMADLDPPTDPDARSKVYARLGRPESPDGYKIPEEGAEFRRAAHKNNLTAEQAEGLFRELSDANKAAKDTNDAKFKESLAEAERKVAEAYKTKWGDSYDGNIATFRKGWESLPQDLRTALEELGFQHDPGFIEHFFKVGQAMAEDPIFGGPGTSPVGEKEEFKTVKEKRLALIEDPEYKKIIQNPMHPRYKEKKEEYEKLMARESELYVKLGI